MLRMFRRNSINCPHQSERYRRCSCPIYVEGRINWKFIRKSLYTRKWEQATLLMRRMESEGLAETLGECLIDQAVNLYLEDAKSRNLAPETLRSIQIVLGNLVSAFSDERLAELSAKDLLRWRTSWNLAPFTSLKRWERIRSFFRWCQQTKLCQTNPCDGVRSPRASIKPKLPYSDDEVSRILEILNGRPQLRALIPVLVHTGLRILRRCSTRSFRFGKPFIEIENR